LDFSSLEKKMSWFRVGFIIRLTLKVFLSEKHLAVWQFLLDRRRRTCRTVVKRKLVTVFCSEDLSYLGLFGIICTELTQVTGAHVECYVSRELGVGESRSFFSFFLSRIIKRPFNLLRWSLLYRSFCHSSEFGIWISRPFSDLTCLWEAFFAWRRATDKDSLVSMQIDGVLVGDLISDSYIRFKPFPTTQLSDWYLLFVIWQAYRSYGRAVRYFEKSHPKLFLTPYSSYIQNGIIVRVLLARGVSVFSFGEYQEFTKKLTQDDWFHTISPLGLKRSFDGLDFKDEKLATAEERLSVRFSGRKDAATAYMAKSAYGYEDVTVPDLTNATIVFLHDFFDAPNLYYDMVFPDFWEWACFTIDVLDESGRSFF